MSRLVRYTVIAWGAFIGSALVGYWYLGLAPVMPGRLQDAIVSWGAVAVGSALGTVAAISLTRRFRPSAAHEMRPEPIRELATAGTPGTRD